MWLNISLKKNNPAHIHKCTEWESFKKKLKIEEGEMSHHDVIMNW